MARFNNLAIFFARNLGYEPAVVIYTLFKGRGQYVFVSILKWRAVPVR